MRTTAFIFLLCNFISCAHEEISRTFDIYNEWKWESTSFDTRGYPVASATLDTTYYYNFQGNGILQLKDNKKHIINEYHFTLLEGTPFNRIVIDDRNIEWGYSINDDTLRIWSPNSIYPRTSVFKAE